MHQEAVNARTRIAKATQRIFSYSLNYLHYVGLALAIVLLFVERKSIVETDHTLRQSVAQQSNLRNILWMNLLIQRSSNMALMAKELGDPSYYDRASLTAESLNQPLGEITNKDSTIKAETKAAIRRDSEEFQAILPRVSQGAARLKEMVSVAEKTGADLNQIESDGWFRLSEQNESLLSQIQRAHQLLFVMLTIFVLYLALLALILQRKRVAEKALRGAEAKMLISARISALGEMAGGVAHEINNPLATIALITEQVKEHLAEKPEENQFAINRLDKVGTTVRRIGQIVLALRTYSRDGTADQLDSVSALSLLESTLSLCQEKFKHRGVKVTLEVVPPELMALCQQVPLSQVLLNLFNNACDAIEQLPEKWIHISVKETPEGLTRFQITDSGAGIPAALQEKIFNPFFTTKEIGKGTGLGLSLSQGIIKAHSGKIYIENSCANTRFVIDLPSASSNTKIHAA